MKRPHFSKLTRPVLLLAVPAGVALANPQGEQVRSGTAVFERTGAGLRIVQGSDRAIIHWSDFSIAAGETTQFVQPGAASATLNRVTGGLPSSIYGSLSANGKIFLINPNGVLVGPGGRVDAQSFIASTLDVPDAAFLSGGELNFSGPSQAEVVNHGVIHAMGGDVFLLGRTVENHGTLTAPQGTVGLGAGQEILLKQSGEERLLVKPAGAGKSAAGVTNTGTIQAASAELKAHGNLYAMAINNQGTIRANGAVKSGGRVRLVSTGNSKVVNTGTISAKRGSQGGEIRVDAGPGGTVENAGKLDAASVVAGTLPGEDASGGSIVVEGQRISLTESAELNASGLTNGGMIAVGGGFQGRDAAIRNAEETLVSPGARLLADGGVGDGGRVFIWSNRTTTFGGEIRAQSQGAGRGGVAEVSSLRRLDFQGTADLRSAQGANGTLILDPNDAEVNTVSSIPGATLITPIALTNQLNFGNVVVHTSGGDAETGTISIKAPVQYASPNSLTFAAHGDILVLARVVNDGVAGQGGSVNFVSGWDGVTGFAATPGAGIEPGLFQISQVLANPASYGNGGAEMHIGAASATQSAAVGSRWGETALFGGSLKLRGTDNGLVLPGQGFAQVGIPAADAPGSGAGGNIRIFMKESVALTGGLQSGAYAQIGHGGYLALAPANSGQPVQGNIAVNAVGVLTLLAGGDAAYAQIGHGGVNGRADLSGNISVTTADALLNAQTSHVQIGHGGQQHAGEKSGSLTLTDSGRLSLRADASFVRVGHGGRGGAGAALGDIAVAATALDLFGGTSAAAMAQIGHGGPNFTGSATGDLALNLSGPVVLSGGQGRGAAAQIGHGGHWNVLPAISPPTLSGRISLTGGASIDLISGPGQPESYAQLGHGGFRAPGDKSGDIVVQTTGTGDIFASAKTSSLSYAQIGHGGTQSPGSATGSISISAPRRSLTLTNDASNTTAQVGHSGNGTGPGAVLEGPITLDVRSLTVDGGFSNGGGALVGHSGGGNRKDGAISVTAENDVRLMADGLSAFARLGHRNLLESDSAASGDITVVSDNVLLTQGGVDGAVQIGHAAMPEGQTTLSGTIAVDAFTLSMEAGNLMGHSGGAAVTGDVSYAGESLTMFGGGRIGHRSKFGERHGGISLETDNAVVDGVVGHEAGTGAVSGDVMVRVGTTLELSGSIGHDPETAPDFSPASGGRTWVGAGLEGGGELILHDQAAFRGGNAGELRIYVPLPESIIFDEGAQVHFNDQMETAIPPDRTLPGFTFGTGPYASPYRVYYFDQPAPGSAAARVRHGAVSTPPSVPPPVDFRRWLQELRAAETPPTPVQWRGGVNEGWGGPVKRRRPGASSFEAFQTQMPVRPQK